MGSTRFLVADLRSASRNPRVVGRPQGGTSQIAARRIDARHVRMVSTELLGLAAASQACTSFRFKRVPLLTPQTIETIGSGLPRASVMPTTDIALRRESRKAYAGATSNADGVRQRSTTRWAAHAPTGSHTLSAPSACC